MIKPVSFLPPSKECRDYTTLFERSSTTNRVQKVDSYKLWGGKPTPRLVFSPPKHSRISPKIYKSTIMNKKLEGEKLWVNFNEKGLQCYQKSLSTTLEEPFIECQDSEGKEPLQCSPKSPNQKNEYLEARPSDDSQNKDPIFSLEFINGKVLQSESNLSFYGSDDQ